MIMDFITKVLLHFQKVVSFRVNGIQYVERKGELH